MKQLQNWFTAHPQKVGETYGEHFLFAASFAWTLFAAALAAFIHALIPALFETTANEKIQQLSDRMKNR